LWDDSAVNYVTSNTVLDYS